LTAFAPGRPLTLVATHADGREDRITLNHTFNEGQIAWFKAGSALNLMGKARK
jgi:aconitate hydratase